MVVKMIKYSFVLMNKELDDFLNSLQELGMVDITRSNKAIDKYSEESLSLSARYKNALDYLSNIANANKKAKKEKASFKEIVEDIPKDKLLNTIEHYRSLEKALKSELMNLERDARNAAKWGDFNLEDVRKINDLGYELHFYTISEKKFNPQWENDYILQILNKLDGKVYFTILVPKNEKCDLNISESDFPETSISEINKRIKEAENELEQLTYKINGLAAQINSLQELYDVLLTEMDMHFANVASTKSGEGSIAVLEGFAPKEQEQEISEFLNKSCAYYLKEEAKEEDNPPIKLKNNKFARLFAPIASLYDLPNYGELDLTPYFAPFYMLFFGFCLGDMGYGLLLVIIGLLVTILKKGTKTADYGKLVTVLGIGSIIMPLFSGTVFGMKLYDLGLGLNKETFFSDTQMFWFSIIWGIVQIAFGRIIYAIACFKHKKFDPAFTNLGWALVLLALSFMYAGSQSGSAILPDIATKIMLYAGLVFILFCSKPTKIFILRPFAGIISLYDITGLFGDVLSYIRLFGLGTSGGILALVVNAIAMQIAGIPYVGWGIAIIILIFGHLAVLGLSALSAFVHPVRLTFVEFYKNASFQGGGRAFNPFKKNIN